MRTVPGFRSANHIRLQNNSQRADFNVSKTEKKNAIEMIDTKLSLSREHQSCLTKRLWKYIRDAEKAPSSANSFFFLFNVVSFRHFRSFELFLN